MKDTSEIQGLREGWIERMNPQMRVQHIIFALCVTMLLISGLALLFADNVVGQILIALLGGFEMRGIIHRIAAVALILITLYHLSYNLFTRDGRHEFWLRMLERKDFANALQTMRFNLGKVKERPPTGKYSPGQKLHYWLAGFFIFGMMISGILLWNPTAAMQWFPRWMLDILVVVHANGGFLALIILVVWHLYDVHLSPRNFPMSHVWLNGRMELDKARIYHSLEYDRVKGMVRSDDEA